MSLSGHSLPIDDLAFSQNGDWLATVGQDKRINMWNVAIHSDAVITVAFSPDGKFLATGSGDKTIKIWKPDTLELVKTLGDHHNRTQKLAFSPPDGKFLASASFDKTARIWDWRMGKEVVPPLQYQDAKYGYDKVYDLAYSSGGQWLATAGANHAAAVWETATGSFKFEGSHEGQVSAVAFSPDDKYLASAGWDGRVNIWEMPSGKFVASVCSPKGRKFLDVNFNPNGEDMVMAMGTPTILVAQGWKRYLKEPLENESGGQDACKITATPLPGTKRPITSKAQFTPDGQKIVTISKTDQIVKIWEASSGDEWKSIPVPAKVNDVAISSDGKWLATAGEDMNFYLFPMNAEDLVAWGCTRVTDRCLTDKECEDNHGYKCPANPCPTECSKESNNVPMH